MGINSDSQLLEPGNLIVLYELDCRELGGDLLLFHGHIQDGPIFWQDMEYKPWPLEATDFMTSGETKQATPVLRVGNIDGTIGALAIFLKDLVGAKLTRRRTLAKYLDAANFTLGNPDADPEEQYPDDVFYIEQKTSHNKEMLEFSLRSALDLSEVFVPRRLIVANVCAWLTHGGYRGPNCAYTGAAMFDRDNNPTADPALDRCAGQVSSCKLRFPNEDIRFGGFPSAGLVRT